jgi:hypothetical protein
VNELTERVFRLRANALSWRELDGEVIAVDLEDSLYLTANESGTILWSALAHGATRDDLVGALVGAYGVARAQAEVDVDEFLADAEARGLLA